MRDGHPLRFYATPVKLLLLLLTSAMFVAVGILMLRDPKTSVNPVNVFMAWAAIVFFGLGVVVFLIVLLGDVVLRRAVLEIDEQGWRSTQLVREQTVNWPDIEHVAVYRQRLGQARSMYYLVIHGRNPNKEAPVTRFSARFYPSLHGSLMTIPLNNLFVRTTPEKVERILKRIRARYAHELQLYGITVDSEIHAL